MKFLFVCLVAVAWAQLSHAEALEKRAATYIKAFPKIVTYLEAEKMCQRKGGWVASIESGDGGSAITEYLRTTSDLQDSERDQDFWTGCNDIAEENEWVTSMGDKASKSGWCPGEPDNFQNEDCTVYSPAAKCHKDIDCGKSNAFLCAFKA